MKCSDAQQFFMQIAGRNISMSVQEQDLAYLRDNGYVTIMSADDYGKLSSEVSELTALNESLAGKRKEEAADRVDVEQIDRKVHSISFHFQKKENREEELKKLGSEQSELEQDRTEIAGDESRIASLIQKKSQMDRLVPFAGRYVSLTSAGDTALRDLNYRNYRFSDSDLSQFKAEMDTTMSELNAIAQRGSEHFNRLSQELSEPDEAQVWSAAIGLAKLRGDPGQLDARFLQAYQNTGWMADNEENRVMAAEILSTFGTDLDSEINLLKDLIHEVRHEDRVPKELALGVAAIILFGRRHDGTFPLDRLREFLNLTSSFESASILSVMNVPAQDLAQKFQSLRSIFSGMGYSLSEDTELSSAYLSISELPVDGMKTKLSIIINGLKTYLEYPLVASSILTSIPVLEANETFDLVEKAYDILGRVAVGLEQSELICLAVRMVHGIRNELVRQLDPTAKIVNTPIQFTYTPSFIFFYTHVPFIVAHGSYYSTFSGIGGFHPGHIHVAGGFQG